MVPQSTYFDLYLPIFTTNVWYFTTVYHKSVVLYVTQNVPQNLIYLTYVPHVTHLGHKWGTQCSPPTDGLKVMKIM